MRSKWRDLSALLLLPVAAQALSFDCKDILADGQHFDLHELGGPKTVHWQRYQDPSIQNTTFTVDICQGLKKEGEKKDDSCPQGTRVCGREYDYRGDEEFLSKVIPIAGEYTSTNGRTLNPKYTRLKSQASNSEEKEGVLIELHGGKFPDRKSGTPQKAIIEFLCDDKLTGKEGFDDEAEMGADPAFYSAMERRDDDNDDPPALPDLDKGKSLKFLSYKPIDDDDGTMVLRLQWKTKYACEGASSKPSGDGSGGWGFFTWFIIILFLLAAAYIIFGSWLNYNRYGARGWDLIPHGDTIRDIPYIVKDWGSAAADRLKGGDNRGGYSAV